jgi:hypothetical protein
MGTIYLYWILNGPSFAVRNTVVLNPIYLQKHAVEGMGVGSVV